MAAPIDLPTGKSSRPGQMCYNLTMRPKNGPNGRAARTFIDAARRAQIVAAAIETIAEVGYGHASLARIAERLGISKGVISYHFAGKEELVREVIAEVYAAAGVFIGPRMEAASSAAARLAAYIEAEIDFLRAYPAHLRAAVEIFSNFRTSEGKLHYDGASEEEPRLALVEAILQSGQESGEFRSFSTRVMSIAIVGAIDGVLIQWVANPDLDLKAYACELVSVFDQATQSLGVEALPPGDHPARGE
jgi:AcrR family transcriptional regulator